MPAYGLLGRRLSHSLSPQIHSHFGSYPYTLIEKEPEALPQFFADCPYQGLNVTIPYKTVVLPFCDALDPVAARMGSVNTICIQDGKRIGYNTDYYGFRYLLEKNGITVTGRKVIVLGSGGASLTVRCVLEDLHAGEIVVISRSGENNYNNISRHHDAEIIINTTPVGMFPCNLQSPIELEPFAHCHAVVDIIYNPLRTKLLLDAERLGLPAVNGMAMLVAQGKRAAELFLQQHIPDVEIEKTTAAMQKEFCNFVLVGMPGCGKSTVGRLLAEHCKKTFADTDDLVTAAAGCPIPEIFAKQGETAFRKLETEAVQQVSAKLGMVIATGGGAVLKEINRVALRQNAKVIFLNRAPDQLAMGGRPLSKDRDTLREMYAQRLPFYRAVCDFEIEVDANPSLTCKRILEALKHENTGD